MNLNAMMLLLAAACYSLLLTREGLKALIVKISHGLASLRHSAFLYYIVISIVNFTQIMRARHSARLSYLRKADT